MGRWAFLLYRSLTRSSSNARLAHICECVSSKLTSLRICERVRRGFTESASPSTFNIRFKNTNFAQRAINTAGTEATPLKRGKSRKAAPSKKADSKRTVRKSARTPLARTVLKAALKGFSQDVQRQLEEGNIAALSAEGAAQVQAQIGYKFKRPELLQLAFVHGSAIGKSDNRLAWVGDAVLYLLVTEHLSGKYHNLSIGQLATSRNMRVSRQFCTWYSQQLKLQDLLIVGLSVKSDFHGISPAMEAELFEAVLGAVYIDGGYVAASRFYFKHFSSLFPDDFADFDSVNLTSS